MAESSLSRLLKGAGTEKSEFAASPLGMLLAGKPAAPQSPGTASASVQQLLMSKAAPAASGIPGAGMPLSPAALAAACRPSSLRATALEGADVDTLAQEQVHVAAGVDAGASHGMPEPPAEPVAASTDSEQQQEMGQDPVQQAAEQKEQQEEEDGDDSSVRTVDLLGSISRVELSALPVVSPVAIASQPVHLTQYCTPAGATGRAVTAAVVALSSSMCCVLSDANRPCVTLLRDGDSQADITAHRAQVTDMCFFGQAPAASSAAAAAPAEEETFELLATADAEGRVVVTALFPAEAAADTTETGLLAVQLAELTFPAQTPASPFTLLRWHPTLPSQLFVARGEHVHLLDLHSLGLPTEVFLSGSSSSSNRATETAQAVSKAAAKARQSSLHRSTLGTDTLVIALSPEAPCLGLDVVSREAPRAPGASMVGWDVGDVLVLTVAAELEDEEEEEQASVRHAAHLWTGAAAGGSFSYYTTVATHARLAGAVLLRDEAYGSVAAHYALALACVSPSSGDEELAGLRVQLVTLPTNTATGNLLQVAGDSECEQSELEQQEVTDAIAAHAGRTSTLLLPADALAASGYDLNSLQVHLTACKSSATQQHLLVCMQQPSLHIASAVCASLHAPAAAAGAALTSAGCYSMRCEYQVQLHAAGVSVPLLACTLTRPVVSAIPHALDLSCLSAHQLLTLPLPQDRSATLPDISVGHSAVQRHQHPRPALHPESSAGAAGEAAAAAAEVASSGSSSPVVGAILSYDDEPEEEEEDVKPVTVAFLSHEDELEEERLPRATAEKTTHPSTSTAAPLEPAEIAPALWQMRVEQAKQAAANDSRHTALLQSVACSLDTLPSALERAVSKALGAQGAKPSAGAVVDIPPQLLADCVGGALAAPAVQQSIAAAVSGAAADAFARTFEASILPGFERAAAAMVSQLAVRLEMDIGAATSRIAKEADAAARKVQAAADAAVAGLEKTSKRLETNLHNAANSLETSVRSAGINTVSSIESARATVMETSAAHKAAAHAGADALKTAADAAVAQIKAVASELQAGLAAEAAPLYKSLAALPAVTNTVTAAVESLRPVPAAVKMELVAFTEQMRAFQAANASVAAAAAPARGASMHSMPAMHGSTGMYAGMPMQHAHLPGHHAPMHPMQHALPPQQQGMPMQAAPAPQHPMHPMQAAPMQAAPLPMQQQQQMPAPPVAAAPVPIAPAASSSSAVIEMLTRKGQAATGTSAPAKPAAAASAPQEVSANGGAAATSDAGLPALIRREAPRAIKNSTPAQQTLVQHLERGHIREAFEAALNASDVQLVVFACAWCAAHFQSIPPVVARLTPMLRICLLQQLVVDTSTDSAVKLQWAKEATAAMLGPALNHRDSGNGFPPCDCNEPMLQSHVVRIAETAKQAVEALAAQARSGAFDALAFMHASSLASLLEKVKAVAAAPVMTTPITTAA